MYGVAEHARESPPPPRPTVSPPVTTPTSPAVAAPAHGSGAGHSLRTFSIFPASSAFEAAPHEASPLTAFGDEQSPIQRRSDGRAEKRPDVASMGAQDKLIEAMRRSVRYMGGETAAKMQALLEPTALATMAGFLIVGVAVQGVPVVDALFDAGALIYGAVTFGPEIGDILSSLGGFASTASSAKTDADLDHAAEMFAHGMTGAVIDSLVAVILHKAGKAKGGGGPEAAPARAGGRPASRHRSAGPAATTRWVHACRRPAMGARARCPTLSRTRSRLPCPTPYRPGPPTGPRPSGQRGRP